MSAAPSVFDACEACLGRAALLRALSGRFDLVRARIGDLLALDDDALARATGLAGSSAVREDGAALDGDAVREEAVAAGLSAVCRCSVRYPGRLAAVAAPPAVLFIAGDAARSLTALEGEAVAIVGTRRPTAYGRTVATRLADGVARAGVPVLSGMAYGIDAVAHRAALSTGVADPVPSLAVLPGSPDRAHPAGHRVLHRQILRSGAALSEMPPGTVVGRWSFPARNRIIAGLATMTVVVEAAERSGSLTTAHFVREAGRPVGAVPGRITDPQSQGTNGLLATGASVVRGPEDVLTTLFPFDPARRSRAAREADPPLDPPLQALLDGLARGEDAERAIAGSGLTAAMGVAALAELELAGRVRRGLGGFTVVR